jgi:diguanylate cyclase (GGDEF)-like protein
MVEAKARADYRNALVKREAPRALVWTGGVIAVLSIINGLSGQGGVPFANALHAGVVLVFLAGAGLSMRPGTPAAVVPWVVAVCSVVFVGSIQLEIVIDPTSLGLAYVLMGMLAYGPFTLSVRAMVTAAVVMAAGFLPASRAAGGDDAFAWCVAGVAALVIGAVLLRVRLRAIDALGDLTDRTRELATRDLLTGVFNRRGVEERVDELVASAARQDKDVFVMFVDIDGLKAANDAHGHEFGDQVIRVVADGLRSTMRASDIVGRWGGDEFIVLGIGQPTPVTQFLERLEVQVTESGIDRAVWPGGVSLGAAVAAPAAFDFDALVSAADANMYAQRRARRES